MAHAALDKLKILLISKPIVIKEIISADIAVVKGLSELALNALYNENIILSKEQKKQLKKYKPLLGKLADRKLSITTKQRYLLKQGQPLVPILLQAILPYLQNGKSGDGSGSVSRI